MVEEMIQQIMLNRIEMDGFKYSNTLQGSPLGISNTQLLSYSSVLKRTQAYSELLKLLKKTKSTDFGASAERY